MDKKKFIDEAARIVRRAYQFSIKSRKQSFDALADDIDADALKRGDVFELGIRMALEGSGSDHIDGILKSMINREKDEEARRLKTIQKEAADCIQKSFNSFDLLNALFSYLDDDEKKEARKLLTEDAFKEYFSFYQEV